MAEMAEGLTLSDMQAQLDQLRNLWKDEHAKTSTLRRQTKRYSAVVKAAVDLHLASDVHMLCRKIEQEMCELLKVEFATLYVFDHDTAELWSEGVEGKRIELGSEIVGRVAEARSAYQFESIQTGHRIPAPAYGNHQVSNMLCIALSSDELSQAKQSLPSHSLSLYGVIQLVNKRDGASFTKHDHHIVDLMSGHFAVAMNKLQHEAVAPAQLEAEKEATHTKLVELQSAKLKEVQPRSDLENSVDTKEIGCREPNQQELRGKELALNKFATAVSTNPNEMHPMDLFRGLDLDKCGTISKTKLQSGLKRVGLGTWTDADVDDLLVLFDTDGDGEIDMKELKKGLEKTYKHVRKMKQICSTQEVQDCAKQQTAVSTSVQEQVVQLLAQREALKLSIERVQSERQEEARVAQAAQQRILEEKANAERTIDELKRCLAEEQAKDAEHVHQATATEKQLIALKQAEEAVVVERTRQQEEVGAVKRAADDAARSADAAVHDLRKALAEERAKRMAAEQEAQDMLAEAEAAKCLTEREVAEIRSTATSLTERARREAEELVAQATRSEGAQLELIVAQKETTDARREAFEAVAALHAMSEAAEDQAREVADAQEKAAAEVKAEIMSLQAKATADSQAKIAAEAEARAAEDSRETLEVEWRAEIHSLRQELSGERAAKQAVVEEARLRSDAADAIQAQAAAATERHSCELAEHRRRETELAGIAQEYAQQEAKKAVVEQAQQRREQLLQKREAEVEELKRHNASLVVAIKMHKQLRQSQEHDISSLEEKHTRVVHGLRRQLKGLTEMAQEAVQAQQDKEGNGSVKRKDTFRAADNSDLPSKMVSTMSHLAEEVRELRAEKAQLVEHVEQLRLKRKEDKRERRKLEAEAKFEVQKAKIEMVRTCKADELDALHLQEREIEVMSTKLGNVSNLEQEIGELRKRLQEAEGRKTQAMLAVRRHLLVVEELKLALQEAQTNEEAVLQREISMERQLRLMRCEARSHLENEKKTKGVLERLSTELIECKSKLGEQEQQLRQQKQVQQQLKEVQQQLQLQQQQQQQG
jgi:hypothetical protein